MSFFSRIKNFFVSGGSNSDTTLIIPKLPESLGSFSLVAPEPSKPVEDKAVEQTSPSQIKRVRPQTLKYAQATAVAGRSFIPPEYNLDEIGVIEDTESYVRRAFSKKLGLLFKEGYSFIGSNTETLDYYNLRMAQIAQASGIPTTELIRRVAHSLIRTSNAFLVKVRNEQASGGKTRVDANAKELVPVAAYFPAAPETMEAEFDKGTGIIVGWKQTIPGGNYKQFRADDVIHFVIDRREGFIFGTPSIAPVIDDIRALRQLEEHIELLVYHHLFPLFQYIVGTETAPAGYTEAGEREIDVAKQELQLMPLEGGIVTPERHKIELIGAEGRALRAESYLEHFKRRVIAGLGISEIDLGIGDTSNRATANTLSRALVDAVKDIQDAIESQWDKEIIHELLQESTFSFDVLRPENLVHLRFHEIDIDNKMEQEKHALDLFKNNGITIHELRTALSRDPFELPDDPHDQDPQSYPEWFSTYWKLIEEPSLLIRAVDEPWSAQAQALARSKGASLIAPDLQQAQKGQQAAAEAEAERERKTKVAVAKAKPKLPTKKDSVLSTSYRTLESDTIQRVRGELASRGRIQKDWFAQNIRLWAASEGRKFEAHCSAALLAAFNQVSGRRGHLAPELLNSGRSLITKRIGRWAERLADDLIASLDKSVSHLLDPDQVSKQIHLVFDTLKYRLNFAWDTEIAKADNMGRLLGYRFLGYFEVTHDSETSCPDCQALVGRPIRISEITPDDIAPHHPNCQCKVIPVRTNKQGDSDK